MARAEETGVKPAGSAMPDQPLQPSLGDAWKRVERIVAAGTPLGRAVHGVELIGVRAMRNEGQSVPEDELARERGSAFVELACPVLLSQARSAYDGRLVVFKGPEIAARYPVGTRWYGDVDLLADDADAAHAALMRAGFVEVEDPELFMDIHHLRPLALPGLPLKLELHHRPKWPHHLRPPSLAALFSLTTPAKSDPNVLALTPEAHVLLVAAHGWAHAPLRGLRDMIDVLVLLPECNRQQVRALAAEWGVARLWRTTENTVDALFVRDTDTLAIKLWGRHLRDVRERTVLEGHLQRWLSPFWAWPAHKAIQLTVEAVVRDIRPLPDENWRGKGRRTRQAIRRALSPTSTHDRLLGDDARRGSRSRRT